MSQLTVYATTSGGSGHILKDGSGSWESAHDATDGDSVDQGNFPYIEVSHAGSTNRVIRGAFTFNTAAIPDDATIDSATFNLTVYSVDVDDTGPGHAWVNVVISNTQASNTALVTEDFDQMGSVNNPTEVSTRKNMTSLNTGGGSNIFTLDATGLAAISKTGYSKFSVRTGNDCADSDIGTGDNTSNSVRFYMPGVNLIVNYTEATTTSTTTSTSTTTTSTSTSTTTTSTSSSTSTSTSTSTTTTSTSTTTTSTSTSTTTTSTSTSTTSTSTSTSSSTTATSTTTSTTTSTSSSTSTTTTLPLKFNVDSGTKPVI